MSTPIGNLPSPLGAVQFGMDKYERRRLRLVEVRDKLCHGSGAELARRIGKSDSYVARMLYPADKKGFKRIGEDTVDAIDQGFRWAPGTFDSNEPLEIGKVYDLLGGRNIDQKPPLSVDISLTKPDILATRNVEPGPRIGRNLPLITWEQAGAWESALNNLVIDDVLEWIAASVEASQDSYYLKVRGQSMYSPEGEPSFREGDLIQVEPTREAAHGALVVVLLPGQTEATFKQLIVEDGYSYLKALNPSWPNRITTMEPGAVIRGVVKSKVVRY